jgi:putative PIN family toxin of toxin-antitoxin system
MRVVVDTNVFVSAALKDVSLPSIALHMVAREHVLLKSAATEAQLVEVIARPYLARFVAQSTRDWLAALLEAAEPVSIAERITACRDPTDDKFLELAVNGHADLILTGDADLLVLNPFRGIPILVPAIFVQSVSG